MSNYITAKTQNVTDIGISLALKDGEKVKVKGIHLKKEWMMRQHQLVDTKHNAQCNCFNDFKSNITSLHIENSIDDISKMNALKKKHADQRAPWKTETDELRKRLDELERKLVRSQAQSTETSISTSRSGYLYSSPASTPKSSSYSANTANSSQKSLSAMDYTILQGAQINVHHQF